jgi:isoleucyl-tRNA synthetase
MAQTEGFVADGDNYVTVVLDTNLTEELLEEGFVREIVSKIQTMRKEADFEVMDRITVSYESSDKINDVFKRNMDTIAGEVLADSIVTGATGDHVKEWNINGEKVTLAVTKN